MFNLRLALSIVIALAFISSLSVIPAWQSQAQQQAAASLESAAAQATQQTSPTPAAGQAPSTHELTAVDIEAFLDGLIPIELKADGIAGAAVAVVKDGQPLLVKGYGYADVEKKRPVTGDATLFRPGSISKLFTWTAVMQQVEQGKLGSRPRRERLSRFQDSRHLSEARHASQPDDAHARIRRVVQEPHS